MKESPGFGPEDILLAVTTLTFDIAGTEMFLPLICGGKMIIGRGDEVSDGEALERLLRVHEVTLLQSTPATWRLLLAAGWRGNERLRGMCGGEHLPPELAEQLIPRTRELWNMYGPTETTIWSTMYRVREREERIPIGRPLGNTTVYVVDESMQPVGMGVAGELLIGGAGVARGYLGRPELNRERFVESAFREGERLYRTGDLCRWRGDGQLEYLGRLDGQVKVRGHRIELGEVEAVLGRQKGVEVAAAAVHEGADGEKVLCGYVVCREGCEVRELREALREALPYYMVPSRIEVVERMPLTASGKINRQALPAPGLGGVEPGEYVAARNEVEEAMVEIWQGVLKVARVGVRDNFFELGGHSLLAMQVKMQLRERVGEFSLKELFEHPTIESLSHWHMRRPADKERDVYVF
jgi:acyl-coenzyme A synthetase/AMP-(fatty) acid ligase/aryl carrier-like protein